MSLMLAFLCERQHLIIAVFEMQDAVLDLCGFRVKSIEGEIFKGEGEAGWVYWLGLGL